MGSYDQTISIWLFHSLVHLCPTISIWQPFEKKSFAPESIKVLLDSAQEPPIHTFGILSETHWHSAYFELQQKLSSILAGIGLVAGGIFRVRYTYIDFMARKQLKGKNAWPRCRWLIFGSLLYHILLWLRPHSSSTPHCCVRASAFSSRAHVKTITIDYDKGRCGGNFRSPHAITLYRRSDHNLNKTNPL